MSYEYQTVKVVLPDQELTIHFTANACVSDLLAFATSKHKLECPERFALVLDVRQSAGKDLPVCALRSAALSLTTRTPSRHFRQTNTAEPRIFPPCILLSAVGASRPLFPPPLQSLRHRHVVLALTRIHILIVHNTGAGRTAEGGEQPSPATA